MPNETVGRITSTAEGFRARVAQQEGHSYAVMRGSYNRLISNLADDLTALEIRMQARLAAGQTIPVSWLHREGAYKTLIIQAKNEFRNYSGDLFGELSAGQKNVIRLAEQSTEALLTAQLPGQGITGTFYRLPNEALRQLTGTLEPGSPLRAIIDDMGGWAASGIDDMLAAGLASGKHPNQITKDIVDLIGTTPARTATVVRTELYRSFREANRSVMQANKHLTEGWIWFAHLGNQTCAACLAMHGSEHPLDEPMGSHPNCRCTMLPKTKSWDDLGFAGIPETRVDAGMLPKGEEWLRAQPDHKQRLAFGNNKVWQGWRDGDYALRDVVRVTHSEAWGTTRTIAGDARALMNRDLRLDAEAAARQLITQTQTVTKAAQRAEPKWLRDVREVINSPNGMGDFELQQVGGILQKQIEKGIKNSKHGKLEAEYLDLDKRQRKLLDEAYKVDAKMAELIDTHGYRVAQELDEYQFLDRRVAQLHDTRSNLQSRMWEISQERGSLKAPDRGDIARQVLGQVRPGFGKGKLRNQFIESETDAIEFLHRGTKNLPKEWVDEFNASGKRIKTRGVQRAHFDDAPHRVGDGNVEVLVPRSHAGEDYREAVATHELTHWAEATRPGLRRAEADFYARRTAGESAEWMGHGYESWEVSRPDAFQSKYMGKDYGGTYYELATMAVQNVFERGARFDLRDDPDMYRWVLGVLAGL